MGIGSKGALWRRNLYILWCTQIISLTSFGFGLPFIPFYLKALGATDPVQLKTLTAIAGAAPAITMAIMAPIWGMLSDKYGRKPMILRAMFMASLIIGGMGLVQSPGQLILLRLMQGVFTGTMTATSAFIAANTPDEHLSYALGFMASSNFLGYAIGPFLGSIFANQFGYRFSFFVGSILMLLGAFLVFFLIQEDKSTFGKPKEVYTKGLLKGKELLSPFLIFVLISLFFLRINRSVFAPYLPLFIEEQLHDIKRATTMTGVVNALVGVATAMAGLFFGRLGDKKPKEKIIAMLLLAGTVAGVANFAMPHLYGFMISYGIFYFFIGGIEPIMTSMAAERTPSEKRGLLFGFQGFVSSLGWVVSPFIGAVISIRYGNHAILILLPLILLFNYALVKMMVQKSKSKEGR